MTIYFYRQPQYAKSCAKNRFVPTITKLGQSKISTGLGLGAAKVRLARTQRDFAFRTVSSWNATQEP